MDKQQKVGALKVLHVGRSHAVFDSRIFEKECTSLASAGYAVSYMTSDQVAEFEGVKNGVYLRTIQGVSNPYRVKQILSYLRQIRRIKKKYLEEVLAAKPDVVHIHEKVLGFLVKKLKKCSMRVIYDIHEDNAGNAYTYFKKYGAWFSKCISFLVKWQEKRIVRAADGIITATDHIAELIKPDLKGKKWEVIYNYPVLEDKSIPRQIEEGNCYVCYTGTMGNTRELERMFEGLAWLDKDIKIVMIGNIAPWYKEKLEGIYKNVEFTGYLGKEEIRALHKGAFAGMCVLADTPNIHYSLPIKMFEYMRDGIPVIASNFPIWRAIVEDSRCGLCVSNDIQEIGRAIDYVYSHPEIGRQMGKNGEKSVLEKYNWKREEEKLFAFYSAVLKERTHYESL